MVDLTAYQLAWIAGGFTVLGSLIAGLVAYWLSMRMERDKVRRVAAGAFRAAFAHSLGQIYLARHHGTHDTPDVGAILKEELGAHAAAVELFRPFVRKVDAFQNDWEQYRKLVRQDSFTTDTAEWGTDAPRWSIVEQQIQMLLKHAPFRQASWLGKQWRRFMPTPLHL